MQYEGKKQAVKVWAETGEISPECKGDDSYFSPPGGISCDVLDRICDELNAEWKSQDQGYRVGWSMGEFRKGFVQQRTLPF